MRILIDNSGYHLENLGDVAMLQAAVGRLRLAWPGAELSVITDAPARLERFCPGARPVSPAGQRLFAHTSLFPAAIDRLVRRLWSPAVAAGRSALQRRRGLVPHLLAAELARRSEPVAPLEAFLEEVRSADLVLGAGGGYLNDVFKQHATGVLATLNLAMSFDKPAAMLGQAIGPIFESWLMHFAAATLRRMPLILLREAVLSKPILQRMGVPTARTLVTGDDALGLAFDQRPATLGTAIGFNVRVATYSGVGPEAARDAAESVLRVAALRGLDLQPIVISLHAADSDAQALARLGLGLDQASAELSPQDVVASVARCRVMVTGSYHAAVFALGQGVPVVGLTRSAYYDAKFAGLAGLFGGEGCRAVNVAEAGAGQRIAVALDAALDSAERVRPGLLESAQRQVEAGLEGSRRLAEVV